MYNIYTYVTYVSYKKNICIAVAPSPQGIPRPPRLKFQGGE